MLITFEWLLDQLEALKERLKDIDYNDPDAPDDHLMVNVNLADTKLSKYVRSLLMRLSIMPPLFFIHIINTT